MPQAPCLCKSPWDVVFGDDVLTSISFGALTGECVAGRSCNNQSDYGIVEMTLANAPQDVPEPGTLALFAAALGLIGFGSLRRGRARL